MSLLAVVAAAEVVRELGALVTVVAAEVAVVEGAAAEVVLWSGVDELAADEAAGSTYAALDDAGA